MLLESPELGVSGGGGGVAGGSSVNVGAALTGSFAGMLVMGESGAEDAI